MMLNAIAMVSSCDRRFSSERGVRWPLMRITGWLPTFKCRSDALRSAAIFRRSLTCIDLSPLPRACTATWIGRVESRFRIRGSQERGLFSGCYAGAESDGREPAVTVLALARGDRLVLRLQARGDLPPPAAADRRAVDRSDRGDFGGGADEEDLLGRVQGLARDAALDHRELEVLGQLKNRGARDPRQDRGGERRGVQGPLLHQEQ